MNRISRGLHLAAAVVLLSAPMSADNGTILHFKNGGQSSNDGSKTVSFGDKITFSPLGLMINNQLAASFKTTTAVEFSADRGAISVQPGQSGTTPVGTTTVDISFPNPGYADVIDLGPAEDQTDPGHQVDPTPTTYDLDDAVITVIGSYMYTGSDIIPTFTVTCNGLTLTEGTDYTLKLIDNNKVGRALIKIEAVGGSAYRGSAMQEFSIARCDLGNATLTLAETKYEFTGEAIEPEVTVIVGDNTLTKDVDYEVSYSNNVEPGTASITITGKDNYAGSATTTFVIEKPALVLTLDGETITPTFNPSGAIAFYTGTHGSAYVKGYSVATGDTVEVTVTPSEGYIVNDFRLTGNLEYKEVPMSDNSVRYKYANPAGSMTIAILFDVDPYTGINSEVTDGLRFAVVDGCTVRVTGAEEDVLVTVFDARGQQVAAEVERSANVVLVRLDRQPQGLYIIKVNNNTFKIYKK